ncbi:50S ribosomal protein L3 [Candidatus Woesearchaeota archaeon]|nr:50S ribosomal protein L3 [Candidatus Woesearchaeota archaeon]
MPTTRNPHRGSMQYWHRRRAPRMTARIRTWIAAKEAKPLGFAGYKVGMTHVIATDNRTASVSKGEDIPIPVTVIECPPLKVAAINVLKHGYQGLQLATTFRSQNIDKHASRTFPASKKQHTVTIPEDAVAVRLICHTQPWLAHIKQKPDVVEIALGGDVKQQSQYAASVLGKELQITDALQEGQQIDVHSVTKGKGIQGPVKRHGVDIRSHKSEKTKRGPGNLGPWAGNKYWCVAHQGQHGFHRRTELNKWLVKIGTTGINPEGGYLRYGLVRNQYALLKGSVMGPSKRLITLTPAQRPATHIPKQAPAITHTSLASKQ